MIYQFFLGQRGGGLATVWMFGACSYVLRNYVRSDFAKAVLVLSAIFLFVPVLWPENGNYSKPFNLVLSVFVSSSVLALAGSKFSAPKHIRSVSQYCYTIYLTHYPLLILVAFVWPNSKGSAVAILVTVCAFAFGYFASFLGERHYRVWRDYAWSALLARKSNRT